MLKGKLIIAGNNEPYLQEVGTGERYPIYDKDLDRIRGIFVDGDPLNFKLIDEFTHPELFSHVGWGEGVTCAKIIFGNEE